MESIEETLGGYGIKGLSVRFVSKIPKDPRHRTKVDYGALKKKIKENRL